MKARYATAFFLVSLLLFLSHQWAMRIGFSHPFADAYLDDLLCMPICLFPVLSGFRFFLGPGYRFPAAYLLGVWAFFSLYFEVVLPRLNGSFTADPADMVCYGISMIMFALMQRPAESQKIAPLPHESGG
jgi:hypothetical protein